jgi:hypothetical protein
MAEQLTLPLRSGISLSGLNVLLESPKTDAIVDGEVVSI